jgi:hypothetical protein
VSWACCPASIQALLIIGAVAVLGWGWDVYLVHVAGQDTMFAGIFHGVLTTVVILLIADVSLARREGRDR